MNARKTKTGSALRGWSGFRAAAAAVAVAVAAAGAGQAAEVSRVTIGEAKHPMAPDMWGIFFEDIDLSLDGGVYAELVRNREFEDGLGNKRELTLEYWHPFGATTIEPVAKGGAHEKSPTFCRVRARRGGGMTNDGYFGMNAVEGAAYDFEVAMRGNATVEVEFSGATARFALGPSGEPGEGGVREWRVFTARLVPSKGDPKARLVFRVVEGDWFDVDCVSLMPADRVAGLFRRDLVEALRALKPSFMRFPGGCWVEGDTMKDAYRWKQTLGGKWERRTQRNVWKYWSTNAVGFHEYLLLGEALGAKPLFCINNGEAHKDKAPLDKMDEFVEDALDCIEYCNGGVDTEWGAKRAAAGHPAPFNLEYLEIGNERWGEEYDKRYALIYDAVKAKYPEVKIISNYFKNWQVKARPFELRDDHDYQRPDWFMATGAERYGRMERGDFGIFVGEYAVTEGTGRYGSLRAAVGEAAYMCSLERNADLVKLAAYAPLFANVEHMTWTPNLIYIDTNRAYLTPSYWVQRLFSENRGDEVLAMDVETSTFDVTVPKTWGAKGNDDFTIRRVQGSALRRADGAIVLKLVNCGEEPATVSVNLSGRAVRTVLTSAGADDANTAFEPDKVVPSSGVCDFTGEDVLPPLSLTIYAIAAPEKADGKSTAEAIAEYEGVEPAARDPGEKIVEAPPSDMRLVLLVGQSNMSGRAPVDEEHRRPIERCLKLTRDGLWAEAVNPFHFDRRHCGVGPADEFARRYLAEHPGETLGLVPCAVGGSPVSSWTPSPKGRRGINYRAALERARLAQKNGQIVAILWHQGETDAAKSSAARLMAEYPKAVAEIAAAFRRDLGLGESVPFIVGEIGRWKRPGGDHAARINPAIGECARVIPNSACVSSEGLSRQDAHHFDSASVKTLGDRYYEAWKGLAK